MVFAFLVSFSCRGMPEDHMQGWHPTKTPAYDPSDIRKGRLGDVPATPFQFPRQWHPAQA